MHGVRRAAVIFVCSMVVAAAACSSGGKKASSSSSRSTSTSSVRSTSTRASTSSTAATTVATGGQTTTSNPCPPPPPIPGVVASPVTGASQLLTDVSVDHDGCVDRVTFDFTGKTTDPPSYRIEYQPGPFKNAESGAAVPIAGQAFIVVRLSPAYSYDFENAKPTYTGAKQIPGTGAHHVREVHETGDSEGVMTWVIGVDAKRPFSIEATGIPQHRLIVTVY